MRVAALFVMLALSAPAPSARADTPSVPPAVAGQGTPVGAGTVNVNTASLDELVRLPGVGPAKAAAVAAFREKHGPFKRIDDLDRVKGFGRKLLGRVRPFVSLTGPTTYVGKPGSRKDVSNQGRGRID